MGHRISLDNLKEIVSNMGFENDGDSNEKQYWPF
jgi:hypothetical protein